MPNKSRQRRNNKKNVVLEDEYYTLEEKKSDDMECLRGGGREIILEATEKKQQKMVDTSTPTSASDRPGLASADSETIGNNDNDDDDDASSVLSTTSSINSANDDAQTTPTTSTPNKRRSRKKRSLWFLFFLRSIMIDLPLALTFWIMLTVYCIKLTYHEIFVPFFHRAERTDLQLLEEFTYYERTCGRDDLTFTFKDPDHGQPPDLRYNASGNGIEPLLEHGAIVVPKLLTSPTIEKLRRYIVNRNLHVKEEEKIELTEGGNRLSYAIDATEDPAVAQAVAELGNNPILNKMLEEVLGPDPALSEMTQITSFFGSPNQEVHSDTESDGNAVKYARTYGHSYTIFIPLQDTTGKMGSTHLCPGTHFCSNDLSDVCTEHRFGINRLFKDKIWKAGDAAMINQHVWHAASPHTDPRAKERIMFCVSFWPRPMMSKAANNKPIAATTPDDTRQLGRGTLFHCRWNMWGHTLQDFINPYRYMKQPLSTLRALGLWKPSQANYGYDLVTSASLRMANNQMGMDIYELEVFSKILTDKLYFPNWLLGNIRYGISASRAWQGFLINTIQKTWNYSIRVNSIAHGIYGVLLIVVLVFMTCRKFWLEHNGSPSAVAAANGTRRRFLFGVVLRLLVTHGLGLWIADRTVSNIRESTWGSNMLSGRLLMRPFPPPPALFLGDGHDTNSRYEENLKSIAGKGQGRLPTTLPEKSDILIGTRYDAEFLASYNRWLDYHPGNVIFRQVVNNPKAEWYRQSYTATNALHPVFIQGLLQEIQEKNLATHGEPGRFLLQDYRSGEWMVLGYQAVNEYVQQELLKRGNGMVAKLSQSMDFMIANYRFGFLRGSILALKSVDTLTLLKSKLSKSGLDSIEKQPKEIITSSSLLQQQKSHLYIGHEPLRYQRNDALPPAASNLVNKNMKKQDKKIQVGTVVMVYFSRVNVWEKGRVTKCHGNHGDDKGDAYYDVRISETGRTIHNVISRRLKKPLPLTEGVRVLGYMNGNVFHGTVTKVMANGDASIQYDDGEFVPRERSENIKVIYPAF